jgi:hypothetical protein
VGLALPVVVIALVVVVVRVVAGARAPIRPVARSSPELQAVARMTGRARLAGVVVGIVVGLVAAYQGGLGRGLLLAAPLCALCVLAGVLVGELRVSAPAGPVRQAALEVRRIRDYVPRALGSAVIAAVALLAVILVLTTAAGSPDDMGVPAGSWSAGAATERARVPARGRAPTTRSRCRSWCCAGCWPPASSSPVSCADPARATTSRSTRHCGARPPTQ